MQSRKMWKNFGIQQDTSGVRDASMGRLQLPVDASDWQTTFFNLTPLWECERAWRGLAWDLHMKQH